MSEIRHARAVSPWFIPNKGGIADDFHGIFDLGGGASVASEDAYVVGKKDKCGTDKDLPESTVPISQYERGQVQTYLTLANLDSEPSGGFSLNDFSDALVDAVFYGKDDFNGVLEQTFWYPKTAVETIGVDIADPEARVERTLALAGDNQLTLDYDNKYLIHKKDVAPSGTSGNYIIDVSDPTPQPDPRTSGKYILRVDRTRNDDTDTLEDPSDYTYDSGLEEITIDSAETDDVYNIYYSASSWGSAGDPTTVDTADPCFIKADSVTVLISDGNAEVELDLLTSISISATLNRIDESVVGKEERVLREIEDNPVTVSLAGRVKKSTILEAFMGELGTNFGITDVKKFIDTVRVTLKVYSDSTKSTFLIGYQVDNLAFDDDTLSFTANEFGTLDLTSSSDNLKITTTEGDLT